MSENYNDKNVKKIMESENVPEELKPESIKILLDKFSDERKKKINFKRTAMRVIPIAAAFAVTVSTALGYMLKYNHDYDKCIYTESGLNADETVESMKYADDYTEVYEYFKRAEKKASTKTNGFFLGKDIVESDEMISEEAGVLNDSNISSNQKKDFSDTYNQESGVLEADIVKTDGNNIYYAYGDRIQYAQVKDGKFLKTNYFYNSGRSVNDMYLYNNMLVVISTVYDKKDMDEMYDCYVSEECSTNISFYSSGDNPKLIGSYSQEGGYNDVRLTDNGYLYLISNTERYYNSKEMTSEEFEKFIPSYSVNEEVKYVEPSCIMIPEYCPDNMYSSSAFTNISAFNLNSDNPIEPTDVKSVAGFSDTIYCSYENLYLTYGYEDTEITRFSIKDGAVTLQASGTVKGYVNDQFSMSEFNGYLRIATTINTRNNPWRDVFVSESQEDYNNCLYVLDMELREVGKVKDFGLNEMIKSVNFQGNIAYIVTFRQTDPLYAVDLSNPQNPVIMDEFKINGFSSYMQKWSDNLLVGFGSSANNNGNVTGVKLTMFDNTDPENLSALDSVEINCDDDGYVLSDAVWERKALLIDSEKNIIGFPVTEGNYNEESESYYIFYSFEDGHFNYLNKVENDKEYDSFNRAIIIGEYVYMLSNVQFKSADMATLQNIQSVSFS